MLSQTIYPEEIDNDQLNSLLTTIKNQDEELEVKNKEIVRLQTKIEKIEAAESKLRTKLEKVQETEKKAIAKTKAVKKKAEAAETKAAEETVEPATPKKRTRKPAAEKK